MVSKSEPCACRLPGHEAEAVDAVAEEQGRMRSEVIRRAVRYYLHENPDNCGVIG